MSAVPSLSSVRLTDVPGLRFGKDIFTTGQAAKICGVAPRTISKWFDAGMLRGHRIPGSLDRRIPRTELVRFLKAHGMDAILDSLGFGNGLRVLLLGVGDELTARICAELSDLNDTQLRHEAKSFGAGLVISEWRPQVVVIDLAMGRGESIDVALRLKKANPKSWLVALAPEDDAEPRRLLGMGFSDVLQYPFDPVLLAESIRARKE